MGVKGVITILEILEGMVKLSRVQEGCYQVCLLWFAVANIGKRRVRPYVCVIV